MMPYAIPFNKPAMIGKEQEYIARAFANGHASGDGPMTKACQVLLEEQIGTQKALLTTSCTHALEMAALLLDIQPGDEIIIPDFTFVSTANAFVLRGARPVFADIRPDTLNIDETQIERLVTPRTRAIVPVHYGGISCEMDAIMGIARQHGIAVVEDNAHGLFGAYHGQRLGTFGVLSTQSFHETKNFSCGEGGALLVNDPALIEQAEIIREKGTNRSRFFRGEIDKYTWVSMGSSYVISDILAAMLLAQLEQREVIQAKRQAIWARYNECLCEWAEAHDVGLPIIPAGIEQSYHLFYLILPSLEVRSRLIDHLKAAGILSVFHYLPLHLSDMGRGFGGQPGDCPVTEELSDRLLRLPFYFGLTEDEQDEVIARITGFEW